MKKQIGILIAIISMVLSGINVSAKEPSTSEIFQNVDEASLENKDIILSELDLKENGLTLDDQISLFSTGVVWNQTYGSQTYSIRKSLSMTAMLTEVSNKPYTTITVTNKSNYPITVIAYKGAIGGSTSIRSTTIKAKGSGSLTITRNDVINYGTTNIQGTSCSLAYTVSMYNSNGNPIPCSVKATKYS